MEGLAESLMDRQVWSALLASAKANRLMIETDDILVPTLFIQTGVQLHIHGLSGLPKDEQQKLRLFWGIGAMFRKRQELIFEAMFLSECWYRSGKNKTELLAPLASGIPFKGLPGVAEGIGIAARDLEGSRAIYVIQKFGRDERQRPVWGELIAEEYGPQNKPSSPDSSLLDALFHGHTLGGKEMPSAGTGMVM
jgi:hypothetical protein